MERERKTMVIIFIGIIVTVIIINYIGIIVTVIIIINYKELQFCGEVLQLRHLVEGNTWRRGQKRGKIKRNPFTSGHVKWDAQHVHENKNMVTRQQVLTYVVRVVTMVATVVLLWFKNGTNLQCEVAKGSWLPRLRIVLAYYSRNEYVVMHVRVRPGSATVTLVTRLGYYGNRIIKLERHS